jgi:hypothetical protein
MSSIGVLGGTPLCVLEYSHRLLRDKLCSGVFVKNKSKVENVRKLMADFWVPCCMLSLAQQAQVCVGCLGRLQVQVPEYMR